MYSMIQDFIKPSENLTIKVEKTFLLIQETLSFLEEPDGIVFSYFSTSLNMLVDIVDSAAAFAIFTAETEIGRTHPLSHIYNNTRAGLCNGIVHHVNAGT